MIDANTIEVAVLFKGIKSETFLWAKVDEQRELSVIRKGLAERIDILIPQQRLIQSSTDGIDERYKLVSDFFVDGVQLSDEFLVVEHLEAEVIIGAATIRKWRMKLDYENRIVLVGHKVAQLRI